jgi:hypothetical protein
VIIGLLAPLVTIVAIALLVRRALRHDVPAAGDGHGVRRFFQLVLLFGLMVVSAIGLAGLLARLSEPDALATRGDAFLARSVAFTVVGLPLLALVAGWVRRDLRSDPRERESSGWVAYVTLASLTSLLVTMFAANGILLWAFGVGAFEGQDLGNIVVWGAVWGLHWWLGARLVPQDLAQGHHLLGSLAGLLVSAAGLGAMFGGALKVLFGLDRPALVVGEVDPLLQGGAALAVGAPVWVLYWVRRASRSERNVTWLTYVLLAGMGGGLATVLVATSTAFYDVLVWLVGDPGTSDATEFFQSLPNAAAAALVGGLAWWYHHATLHEGGPVTQRGEVERVRDYLLAGIALGAASGGVILLMVALVEALTGTRIVAGDQAVNTLLSALTLLLVGGPVWWSFWHRGQAAAHQDPEAEYESPSRRVYLFVLLGVASLASVVSLLVGAYLFIEDILDTGLGSTTLHRMRFPIAVLVAAGAVAAYHWTVYGVQRRHTTQRAHGPRFILLVGPPRAGMVGDLARATGGTVRAWTRADGVGLPWTSEQVLDALAGIVAEEVVVVAEDDGVKVIPVHH